MPNDPFLSQEDLRKIVGILDAETDRLDDLLRIAGLDPATDIRGSNFVDCDFGDVDIAGWDLSKTRLDGANLSQVQNIEQAFFAGARFAQTKLPVGAKIEILLAQRNPSAKEA